MKIKRLDITNFKNITKLSVDPTTINLIAGQNGSGKSSLVEALVFMLTNHLDVKIENYIRWGQDQFCLNMNFTHLDCEYNYEIKCGKKTERLLSVNSEEYKGSEAVNKLKEIIDPNLTLFSCVAMQHKATELLFETPVPRLQKLKLIFGMDKVNIIVEAMKNDSKDKRIKIDKLDAEIGILKSRTFSYEIISELPAIGLNDLTEKEAKLKEKKEHYDNETKLIEKYNEEKNRYDTIQNNISDYTTKLNEFEIEVKTAGEGKKRVATIDISNLSTLKQEKEKLLNEKIKLTEEQATNLININKVNMLNESIKEKEKEKASIESGICPMCKQTIKNDDLKIEIMAKITEIQHDVNSIVFEDDNNFIDKLKKIEELIKINIKEIDIIEVAQGEVEKIKLYNQKIDDNLSSVKENIIKYKTLLEECEKVIEPTSVSRIIRFNQSDLDKVEQQIIDYKYVQKENARIEENNAKIKKEENEIKLQISDKGKLIDKIRIDVRILKQTYEILDKEFSSYLIDTGTSYVKNKMNEFFQRAYGKYIVEFKHDGKGIEFYYSDNGTNLYPVNMLSGFEKQIFSIAFRVALNALQDLGIMVLDEIDSDASSWKSQSMYQTLLNEKFNQLFIITHNKETKEYLSNLKACLVYELENGKINE